MKVELRSITHTNIMKDLDSAAGRSLFTLPVTVTDIYPRAYKWFDGHRSLLAGWRGKAGTIKLNE